MSKMYERTRTLVCGCTLTVTSNSVVVPCAEIEGAYASAMDLVKKGMGMTPDERGLYEGLVKQIRSHATRSKGLGRKMDAEGYAKRLKFSKDKS